MSATYIGTISGSGTIDCKNLIPNYTSVNESNFLLNPKQITVGHQGSVSESGRSTTASVAKTYNSSTGILSVSMVANLYGGWVYARGNIDVYYVDSALPF